MTERKKEFHFYETPCSFAPFWIVRERMFVPSWLRSSADRHTPPGRHCHRDTPRIKGNVYSETSSRHQYVFDVRTTVGWHVVRTMAPSGEA